MKNVGNTMLSREIRLTGSVFNYLPHIYIKEKPFSHQLHGVQGKENPLRKSSVTALVKVAVLEYVSWTNRKHKIKIKDSVSSPSNR